MGEVIAIQQEIVEETHTALQQAEALAITSNIEYVGAGSIRQVLVNLAKQIGETFDPIVAKAHATHKEAVSQRKKHLEPVEQAQKIIKRKMIGWESEQERLRREEERELQVEAQKQAEEEALRAAVAAEEAGDIEVAEAIIQEPVMAAPVVLPKSVPKVDGFVSRTVWKFRITDEKLIPREYLMADEKKLGGIARAMKNDITIPGVEIYPEEC